MATLSRQQPPWQLPPQHTSDAPLPPLKIWNSLTRSKTPFIPLDQSNRRVTWYACGPTVYDDAHLGHARNYVSTDIVRRIMRDYFKFDVEFVMNITDIDDKIILRGRQQHLFEEYKDTQSKIGKAQVEADCRAALNAYISKNLTLLPHELPPEQLSGQISEKYAEVLEGKTLAGGVLSDKEAKLNMHIRTVRAASKAMVSYAKDGISLEELNHHVQDILLPYLDSLYGPKIDASDHSIFTKLTKKFEDRFTEDVRALNCLDPDVITRVTEYGPQIVDFVGKVLDNNFAYKTSDGSVYFDIKSFEAANNSYARLEPWNRNDKDLQADGEGALTKKTSEKRSDADFALWKSSKPGEPSWPSPWGGGRPGWHIECSAMASDKLGGRIDIHSGGIDLAFPHHDNEIAQSEAYWCEKGSQCSHQWVNYFIHIGHLSIQGSKMSKSLKNFTTIREALGRGDWTPRGLRIVFLLGGWREGIEITDDLVKEGSSWEDKLNNFFIKANDVLENQPLDKDDTVNKDLEKAFAQTKENTDHALCDSFNTASVMKSISELISVYNLADKKTAGLRQILDVARWITSMVNIFGLNGTAATNNSSIGWSGIGVPEHAKPWLSSVSHLRDDLRRTAKSKDGVTTILIQDLLSKFEFEPKSNDTPDEATIKPYARVLSSLESELSSLSTSVSSPKDLSKQILSLCDRIRDVDLWNLDIYLEDREAQPALIRPVTRELRAAKEAARLKASEEAETKRRAKAEREKEAKEKAEKGKLDPKEMFRTEEYSAWDEEGLPTRDRNGGEVPKSKGKKLRKEWERQQRLHEAWKRENGLA
ncbi:MAG: hypothetical protein LQ342_000004 [Letrouitia transgressa]|nr:MAG: hypothetical protein LQ342_000004 [Letrouitia transgressa]